MVREVTRFVAEDGSEHATREFAEAQERFIALSRQIDRDLYLREDADPDSIVKWIADHARQVREFLDALGPKP